MFAGFLFAKHFLRRHKFWLLHRQFLLPNSRNEEMMGDEPFGATAAGLFWTVNVCEHIL